ncbi:ubiquitin carboxyl-terminal hydrolase, partial [Helicosporidium sp. ATCC 50920]
MEVDSDPERAGLEERQQANDNGEREHGPEPMEGTVSESTQHRNHPEHLKGEFTWEIPNFSQIEHKEYSDKFEAGGSTWRLLVFPHGNNTDHLSVFLAIPDAQDLPSDWTLYAAFRLHLFSSRGHEHDLVKDAQHHFSRREVDWGYNTFIPLSELHDPARGFLSSGSLTLRVQVWVNPTTNPYAESRADTGFVGLKNQGATCYMNSLLQTLYAINAFRRAVYHMPSEEGDGARGGEATGASSETGDKDEAEAIPAALQRVFWRLQFTDGPVGTKELTRSFGWDSSDAFQQHDVQELNRILCDRLEVRMKGTKVEGTIAQLFEGHTHNYIECLNVDCRSTRRESFQDLQLDVAGCRTVLDSFDRYCAPEILEGENQYVAEGHGLQDARKGVLFEDFPPVLQLQLKRFEYDYAKDAMVKLNTRYEFGDTLDLDSHGRRYLAPAASPAVRNLYRLLAVLVHSGGVHGGHYYAYVRPEGSQWLKFDDERVEKVEAHAAVEDNWGGGGAADGGGLDGSGFLAKSNARAPPLARLARHANAYMLVYVRASEWDSVLCSIRAQDIP